MTTHWAVGRIRMDLPMGGALYLPGFGDNYVSTPSDPANTIHDNIDIRLLVALTDWTPASPGQVFAAKVSGLGALCWQFTQLDDGKLSFAYGPEGTGGGVAHIAESTAAVGFTDATTHWARVTRRRSDGRTQFFTAGESDPPAPPSWTQLGSDVIVGAGVAMRDDGVSQDLTLGARGDDGLPLEGLLLYAELRDGIDGTVVNYFDATAVTRIGVRNPSTVSDGGPWTVNGGAWDWVTP